MWKHHHQSKVPCQNVEEGLSSSSTEFTTAGTIQSSSSSSVARPQPTYSQEISSATTAAVTEESGNTSGTTGAVGDLLMEQDLMPKDLNSLRTWPVSHPSRGQVRSCIEFSQSPMLPTSTNTTAASITSSITSTNLSSSACATSSGNAMNAGSTPPASTLLAEVVEGLVSDGHSTIKQSFANFTSVSVDHGVGSRSNSSRGIPHSSASSHDLLGAATGGSRSSSRNSFLSLREGTSSTLPRQSQSSSNTYQNQRAISVSSSNPFLDLNLVDFADLQEIEGGEDGDGDDEDEVDDNMNTPSGREALNSLAASCDESCASGASGMSSNMEADSLEDLHRQQDQEFQDLLEDFAEQQFELEQRKPPCPSHTSLSLSSLVSGDGDTTSESSCGTLSEVFDSLSRFSQHCLVSMEEALTISSPLYHHHTQSSSFTTTPTAERGDFEFSFDYEPPPSMGSVKGMTGVVGASSSQQQEQHQQNAALFSSAHAQQVIYENQEAIDRQRERDLMHVIPRRRLSSMLDSSRQSLEGSSSTSGAVTGSCGVGISSGHPLTKESVCASAGHYVNDDLRAQRVRDWSAHGEHSMNSGSSGIASCGGGGDTGDAPSNATSTDNSAKNSVGKCNYDSGSGSSGNKRQYANKGNDKTATTWTTMSGVPTVSAINAGGGASEIENGSNPGSKSNGGRGVERNENSTVAIASGSGAGEGDGDSCDASKTTVLSPIDIGFDFDLFVTGLGFRNVSSGGSGSGRISTTAVKTDDVGATEPSSSSSSSAATAACLVAAAIGDDSTSNVLGTIENSLLLRAAAAAAVSVVQGESGQVLVTPMDWQERCVELEFALQRFGEQAARVRLLLRDKLAELERRVVEAESRAEDAEDKLRVMEQQLSEATANAASWAMGEEPEKVCSLQHAVREKDRVISRLESQVEEQRILRLQESRQVEEKAAKIKEWVSNKLRDLEDQNEHLREQNQKCETQLELLRSRLTQLSQLNSLQSTKSKDRHSTEDSSRGSYEGDRPPSDESPPPDSGENGQNGTTGATQATRPMSATAACLAAIRRRSGAFDNAEERKQRRRSNMSSGSTSGATTNSLRDPEHRSRDSRGSRVDSGSVDMDTPQSLSPRSPLDSLEIHDTSIPAGANGTVLVPNGSVSVTVAASTASASSAQPMQGVSAPSTSRNPTTSSCSSSTSTASLYSSSGGGGHPVPTANNINNNNNHVIINSPAAHPVPPPVPVLVPQSITISQSASPATPASDVVMIGGSESTQSLQSDRRVPIVPPRRCRTRSPTPNTSHGTTPGTCSPPTEEEDASVLRARLDAECQQLARDLQAAVRELVRPELNLVGAANHSKSNGSVCTGTNGIVNNSGPGTARARAMDEIHDYSEIYTPSGDKQDGLPFELSQPPPPPMHRFPSWESRIYEVAAGGLKLPSKEKASSSNEIASASGTLHQSYNSLGINISIPVYTTVKGRASQIRSAPFSGDSSDSSDGEEMGSGSGSGPHPMSSGETDISSPGKSAPSSIANSLSPLHRSSSSPSKSLRREPSFESEVSDDYAIPPDAFASETNSLDIALSSGCRNLAAPSVSGGASTSSGGSGGIVTIAGSSAVVVAPSGIPLGVTIPAGPSSSSSNNPSIPIINSVESSPRKESLEKAGYLTKLGGKLKTWRKRYFVLRNGTLTYWKSQQESSRRPAGREIILDENCRIIRGEGAATFEIVTGKKTYYLTADSTAAVDDWVRVLQNVVRRNATKLVLSMEDSKPTIQGWMIKVKNGHSKQVWCVLIGKMFLAFKSPSDTVTSGQINMRDARVEDVEHGSGSDTDEKEESGPAGLNPEQVYTIGVFPSHQSPIYLHFSTKQEKDAWLYHLTVVSGKGPSAGTQFEQLVHKLMEVDGDPNCNLWKNPLLLHSKESITSPLTSLSSEALQNEAVKLFKSCQLFMSVPLDASGIDYHVVLAQNALQLCLDYHELQAELICALVKQTSRVLTFKNSAHVNRTFTKIKHSRHFLLNATQSLFLCDSSNHHGKVHNQSSQHQQSSSQPSSLTNRSHQTNNHHGTMPSNSANNSKSSSPIRTTGLRGGSGSSSSNKTSPAKSSSNSKSKGSSSVPSSPLLSHGHGMHYHHSLTSEGKSGVRSFVFVQGWQLLSLAVSLFLPKNNKLLWYLKQHLTRNVDTKSECGKYAAYCQRSVERTLANGPRLFKPSRMEVLSILMKNPFHHSLPHSVPVHFMSGAYQVVGFDGSTTVEEFLLSLCHEIGCREPFLSGFALFEDDPFEKDLEHSLRPEDKICDVISQWETVLRERGLGKFETRRVVTLTFKSRIYRKSGVLQETDKERLLLSYQANQAVVAGKFPLTRELALELAALMAQIDSGDYRPDKGRGSGSSQTVVQILEKYYPTRYRENLAQDEYKILCDSLVEKWSFLKGKNIVDCVRIYLTCTRKWPFFGATLFSVTVRGTHSIEDGTTVWAAVGEDGIAILDHQTLQQIVRYSYGSVQTFGGALDDHFMIVVDDCGKKRRLLFGGMSKLKVFEITRLVADYINACCQNSIYGTTSQATSGLTRHNSLKSCRFHGSTTLPPPTPKLDRKHLGGASGSPAQLPRCDSAQAYRNQRT